MRSKFVIGILFIAAVVLSWKILSWSQQFKKETGLSATTIVSLTFNGGLPLAKTDGRTNLLVLGISGGSHAGADLTDTMLVVSFNQTDRTVTTLSIPRDLWSDTLQDKVNSAYHYGGLKLAKTVAEEAIGIPIHYGFVIDFSGFTKIIDLVGGVDVVASKAFTDPDFPIVGKENDLCAGDPLFRCRYETIHFDTGTVHMDGTLALKYVRSRHAEGEEGSDFARSRRQQDVFLALRKKIQQPSMFLRPLSLLRLLLAFDDATDMDMNIGQLLTMAKLLTKVSAQNITKISFEDQLENPPAWQYGGRYVLVPREGSDAVYTYIKSKLR